MTASEEFPRLHHPTVDAVEVRRVAEFYRQWLGLSYTPADDPGPGDDPERDTDEPDWITLMDDAGVHRLGVQRVSELPRATWPDPGVPMQVHVEWRVSTRAALERQRDRAVDLGATLLLDRSEEDEPVYVFADPAGHPFCLLAVLD